MAGLCALTGETCASLSLSSPGPVLGGASSRGCKSQRSTADVIAWFHNVGAPGCESSGLVQPQNPRLLLRQPDLQGLTNLLENAYHVPQTSFQSPCLSMCRRVHFWIVKRVEIRPAVERVCQDLVHAVFAYGTLRGGLSACSLQPDLLQHSFEHMTC